MDCSATTPERLPDRAPARAARALLLPEFAACAAAFALVLGLVRAAAEPAQVPPRSFMQQVLIDLSAKDRVRQLHLTDFLAIQVHYVDDRHNLFSFFTWAKRTAPSFAFFPFRMTISTPLGPGTDPRTSSRFSSVSTFTTFKFFA